MGMFWDCSQKKLKTGRNTQKHSQLGFAPSQILDWKREKQRASELIHFSLLKIMEQLNQPLSFLYSLGSFKVDFKFKSYLMSIDM